MDITKDYKDEVGMQLTRRVGQLLTENTITMVQASEIAKVILEKVAAAKSLDDFKQLMQTLQAKWPFFNSIETLIQTADTHEKDQQKAQEVAKLIKENQVDQALVTATSK